LEYLATFFSKLSFDESFLASPDHANAHKVVAAWLDNKIEYRPGPIQQGLLRFGLPALLAAVYVLPNKSKGGGLPYLVAVLATNTLQRATYQTGPETMVDS
jgi:hypothetical protein